MNYSSKVILYVKQFHRVERLKRAYGQAVANFTAAMQTDLKAKLDINRDILESIEMEVMSNVRSN
jgi:hypothetical protein